jgi:hypothetical protein
MADDKVVNLDSSLSDVDSSDIEPDLPVVWPTETIELESEEEEEPQPSTSKAEPPKKKKATTGSPPAKKSKVSVIEFLQIGKVAPGFHQQNPGRFRNNCTLAIFFTWLELVAYTSVFATFEKFLPKESNANATLVFNTLKVLLQYFKEIRPGLPHDPVRRSIVCLRNWMSMAKQLDPNLKPVEENNVLNCSGSFKKWIQTPLSELSKFLVRRMCSCAVKKRDQFLTPLWKRRESFYLWYVFKHIFNKSKQIELSIAML